MDESSHAKSDGRAFVTLLLAWGLLVAGVTGWSMAWGPSGPHGELLRGRTCFTRLLHLAFGHLLLLAATWHLFAYNWKPFRNYLAQRPDGKMRFGGALGASVLVTAGLTLLVLLARVAHWGALMGGA